MRRAVRAIIIHDDKLLVMHRDKFGEEYDTLPGGNVEINETLEQALVREIDEETSVKFTNPRLVFLEHAGQPYGDQYIYLCQYVAGRPKLHPDSEEEQINKLGRNLYRPGWLELKALPDAPFLSATLKRHILNALNGKWPDKLLEFNT